MSSNLNKLTNTQQIQVESIIVIGNELGLDDILIETAILIANAGWETAWTRYLRDNPGGALADQTVNAVRNNEEAQIRAFYNELQIYNDRFPAVINPGFQNKVDQLVQDGYSPNADIRQYAYLRHNTGPPSNN